MYIAGKVRALKMQKMERDTRENWDDTISETSGKTIKGIYGSIRGIVVVLTKV